MANYVTNRVIVKGDDESVLKFINLGLKGSGLKPSDSVAEGFKRLKEEARVKSNVVLEDGKRKALYESMLTMGTFYQMPDTFLLHDTTNRNIPNAAAYQRRRYGVAGWYDYNNLKRFGCKWDAPLEDAELLKSDSGKWCVSFFIETPWSYPYLWLSAIKRDSGCDIYLASYEESDAWCFWGKLDESDHDYLQELDSLREAIEDDSDWDRYFDDRDEVCQRMMADCECEALCG